MAKILVAEDERDIRELVAFTLRFGGHEVVLAANGAEAVDLAAANQPNLVLMDVRMPRMNGFEACQQIKADPGTQHIPVVFLSAIGMEKELRTGLDLGASGYIQKPFAPDELIRRVNDMLGLA